MLHLPTPPPSATGDPHPDRPCHLPRFFHWRAPIADAGRFSRREWTCGDGTPVTPEMRDQLLAMIPTAEQERCATAYRAALESGAPYESEFQLLDADGTPHWFVDIGVPCPASEAPGILNGVTLDITRRRRQAETLLEREAMLEAMSDLSHDTYWVAALDFSRVHYVSSSYGRNTGLRRDRLQDDPMDWFHRVHPGDVDRVHAVIREVVGGRLEWFSEECRMLADDGTVREMQLRGRVLRNAAGERDRIAGLASDITERRAAERALRLSEERFNLANRGSSDGIFDWDITRRALYLSPRWKEMLGYADDELPGSESTWQDRLHPDDRDRALTYLAAYLGGDFSEYSLEHRLRHRDGTYRWILARGTLVRDPDGRPVRMVGAHTDITDRKELEQTILAAVEEERRTIGSDLHDDLGQRFTALELMSEALREQLRRQDPSAAGTAAEISRGIRDTIVRIRRISHGLAPQTIDPAGLADALRELAHSVESHSGITCRYTGPGAVTVTEPEVRTHLYRIAQEAVNNALRHARPGRIDIGVRRNIQRLTLEVRDDGPGFDPARRPGPGRGLQLMRQRATLIGAILEVDSQPGSGTAIRCHFGPGR